MQIAFDKDSIINEWENMNPGFKSSSYTTVKNIRTMKNQVLIIGLFTVLSGLLSCKNKSSEKMLLNQKSLQEMTVTVDTLKKILDAFNRHDLDAIMEFFADDCSFDMPRGPEPWGQRFTGKVQVREALASRFKGIPDVHYGDERHWVAGDRGVSEWTLTGTTTAGVSLKVRGCDLWEFRNGKVIRKDSYWKIIQ
jgi:ketosteroid isomerase-like protein